MRVRVQYTGLEVPTDMQFYSDQKSRKNHKAQEKLPRGASLHNDYLIKQASIEAKKLSVSENEKVLWLEK